MRILPLTPHPLGHTAYRRLPVAPDPRYTDEYEHVVLLPDRPPAPVEWHEIAGGPLRGIKIYTATPCPGSGR